MYGPRFADKKLALRDDNSLLYRPSDGPLPPTAPWAVGDVCRVANLETGELAAAVIEKFEDYLPHMGQSFVVVRLLQYTDVPVVQTVPVNALQPLSEEDFVVAAARGGILDGKGASGASGGADMTKTEQEIHSDCRKVLGMISQLLDDGGRMRLSSLVLLTLPSFAFRMGRSLHCRWT